MSGPPSSPPPGQHMALPDERRLRRSLLVGLALPLALILLGALCVPASAGRLWGISAASWSLFACAPLTSLALALCWRWEEGTDRSPSSAPAPGADAPHDPEPLR